MWLTKTAFNQDKFIVPTAHSKPVLLTCSDFILIIKSTPKNPQIQIMVTKSKGSFTHFEYYFNKISFHAQFLTIHKGVEGGPDTITTKI